MKSSKVAAKSYPITEAFLAMMNLPKPKVAKVIDVTKMFKEHQQFVKQISKLSLTEAEELRDSGTIIGSPFDTLCNYIGKKLAAQKPTKKLVKQKNFNFFIRRKFKGFFEVYSCSGRNDGDQVAKFKTQKEAITWVNKRK
jgi:hypothetical protein